MKVVIQGTPLCLMMIISQNNLHCVYTDIGWHLQGQQVTLVHIQSLSLVSRISEGVKLPRLPGACYSHLLEKIFLNAQYPFITKLANSESVCLRLKELPERELLSLLDEMSKDIRRSLLMQTITRTALRKWLAKWSDSIR